MTRKKQYRVICQQFSKLAGKVQLAETTVEAAFCVVNDAGVLQLFQDINDEEVLTWALPQGLWMEIELVGVEDGGEAPDAPNTGVPDNAWPPTAQRPGPA